MTEYNEERNDRKYTFISSIVLGIMVVTYPFLKSIEGMNVDSLYWVVGVLHLMYLGYEHFKAKNDQKNDLVELHVNLSVDEITGEKEFQEITVEPESQRTMEIQIQRPRNSKPKVSMEKPQLKPIPRQKI